MKARTILLALGSLTLVSIGAAAAVGAPATSHATVAADLGVASRTSALEAVVDQPGPVTVETVVGADWSVPLSGLVDLDDPKAVAAGLTDRDEPVQVVFHAVRHPTRGLFLVDTGVERALRDDPEHAAVHGLAADVMHVERMKIRTDTASWLAARGERPAGVFLTHLHLDHVSGLRDVPSGVPVYTGPGEATTRAATNFVVRPITDAALEGKGDIREWRFSPDPDGVFDGVVDVFGDGTFWAIHVPGHTRGSTAYLARTPKGPVLLTGDASHTAWGWEHDVSPGTFSEDEPRSKVSLDRLEKLVARHPGIEVRLGHQPLAPRGQARTAAASVR